MTSERCVAPILTKRDADLGWIASTPADHPWRIAVFGADEVEARNRFIAALARWESLSEDPS